MAEMECTDLAFGETSWLTSDDGLEGVGPGGRGTQGRLLALCQVRSEGRASANQQQWENSKRNGLESCWGGVT